MDALYQEVLDSNEKHPQPNLILPSLAEMKDGSVETSKLLLRCREQLYFLHSPIFTGRYKDVIKAFHEFYPLFLKQQTMEQKMVDINACATMLRDSLEYECAYTDKMESLIDHMVELSAV
jgi:hypothetical protein